MSQQLTISSLFSAFALVSLALFARAGAHMDAAGTGAGPLTVEIHAPADLSH